MNLLPASTFAALTAASWLAGLLTCGIAAAAPGDRAGVPFDLQGFIDGEIASGSRNIVVPPGRYRVTPRNRHHLILQGLSGVTIVAEHVEMICTETTRALTITRCTNVTVHGLIIDYDPLPFTQGRITGFSADKKVHEIELFEGYPSAAAVRNFKYEIFRPDTRTLRGDDRYPTKVEVVDASHIRIVSDRGSAKDPEQIGDIIAIGAEVAPHGSIPHAVECSRNVNVRLGNIDLFASNCFGFLEYDCDGSTYYRCRIDRRPASGDLVPRADPRIRSLDADAFHSKHAIKGPAYIECSARFMGDDAVNICGDYHLVMGSHGKELRVLAKHDMNILPGDPVELVAYDGRRLPDANVISVQPAGAILEPEREFLSRQRMDAGLKAARGGTLSRAYAVTLDREVELAMGGVICSANRIGNGFAVRNCTFGNNRSRGVLIKASRGEVSGNRLEGSRMSAILVSPEYWWLEAGSSSDLKITGNQIADCGGTAIRVEARGGDGKVAPAGAHRNLVITGNTITRSPSPAILVTSTDGLRVEHNTFRAPVPGDAQANRLAQPPMVRTENCENCTLNNDGLPR